VLGALLNEYVGGMTDVVFAHEGTVAKIIGDAIHILFNAPGDQPDYATRAIACAHDLDMWAEGFRGRWKAKNVNFGATRIGVHAGPALVGNFGGNRFFDYTAYGDTINIAARLETANSSWAPAFASARRWPTGQRTSAGGQWATCCCAGGVSHFVLTSHCRQLHSRLQ
jgi:class 3 adenylate cyclase